MPPCDHDRLGTFFGCEALKKAIAVQILPPNPPSGFKVICVVCDGLGIIFECGEAAPSSTQIKCRHCGAPRGTLADLRSLSVSGKQDLFEI